MTNSSRHRPPGLLIPGGLIFINRRLRDVYEPITLCSRCAQEYRDAGIKIVHDFMSEDSEPCDKCRRRGWPYLIDRGPKRQKQPPDKKGTTQPQNGCGARKAREFAAKN
jgi:hypothetical protein